VAVRRFYRLVSRKDPPLNEFHSLIESGHLPYDDPAAGEVTGARTGSPISSTYHRIEGEQMGTGFEIWDSKSHNLLQFDSLDGAIRAVRSLVRSDGEDAVVGLSLDAVSEDGAQRITLAEDKALLSLVSTTAAA